jgi:hypothetical protein
MPEQTISVEFKALCEAVSDLCCVSIEHDDVLNGGASSFQVGDQIFYKVFPAGNYSYFLSLGGTISVITSSKIGEETEEINFSGGDQANMSYPLGGAFSYKWIGSALQAESPHAKCTPAVTAEFGSATLTAKEAVHGALEVTYECTHASVKFMPANLGKQIVLVCRACDSEEVCDSITEEIEDQVFDDVTLTISDACESELKVAGAQVEVNGVLVDGVTNEGGQIHVGLLAKGSHTIKVTAPGYVDSNADYLSNDVIVVG